MVGVVATIEAVRRYGTKKQRGKEDDIYGTLFLLIFIDEIHKLLYHTC